MVVQYVYIKQFAGLKPRMYSFKIDDSVNKNVGTRINNN